ncbi:hypothetical protein AX16_004796 [Volvariella volvacea WC 439]|nr:hypothetical protein AX16_004796 [Volvariella volvacea WC 439]
MVVPAPEIFLPIISFISVHFFDFYERKHVKQASQNAQSLIGQLQLFWDEIERYTSLKRLGVHWSGYDLNEDRERSIHQIVADKLFRTVHQATNGKLDRLLSYTQYSLEIMDPIPQSFESSFRLQDLHAEAYYGGWSISANEPYLPIKSLLGNSVLHNPTLRSLSVRGRSPYPICAWDELLPVTLDKLLVERIEIEGYLPNASPTSPLASLPKLPNLKDLSIRAGLHPKFGINIDPLWAALKASNTRLATLTLEYGLSDLLAEYLSSYSGLSHLEGKIRLPSISSNGTVNRSHSFLQRVLPHHASSLVSLHLRPDVKTDWADFDWQDVAINPLAWPLPSTFTKLTTLTVITLPTWELTAEHCQYVLDYISEIPRLQSFEVEWLYSCSPTDVMDDASAEFDKRIGFINRKVFIKRCLLIALSISMILEQSYGQTKKVANWYLSFPCIDNDDSEDSNDDDEDEGEGKDDKDSGVEGHFPLSRFYRSSDFTDSDIEYGSDDTLGINLNPLWRLLKDSNAHLTNLALGYGLSDLLAEYLASYSGLSNWTCKLYLPPATLSSSFLQQALPHHVPSLTSLTELG